MTEADIFIPLGLVILAIFSFGIAYRNEVIIPNENTKLKQIVKGQNVKIEKQSKLLAEYTQMNCHRRNINGK